MVKKSADLYFFTTGNRPSEKITPMVFQEALCPYCTKPQFFHSPAAHRESVLLYKRGMFLLSHFHMVDWLRMEFSLFTKLECLHFSYFGSKFL